MASPAGAVGFNGLRFNPHTAATFHVFPGLQIPNDGLFQIFLQSAPNGSDHAEVWLFCIFAQTGVPPVYGGPTFYGRIAVKASRKPKRVTFYIGRWALRVERWVVSVLR